MVLRIALDMDFLAANIHGRRSRLAEADAKAEQVRVDARREARELADRARRDAQSEAERLVQEAVREAEEQKRSLLAQAAETIRKELAVDERLREEAVRTVVGAVRGQGDGTTGG